MEVHAWNGAAAVDGWRWITGFKYTEYEALYTLYNKAPAHTGRTHRKVDEGRVFKESSSSSRQASDACCAVQDTS
jgi:hypothetical protein